ncbi:hypothetical protein F5884DRAFT_680546 [Xylogone sp. PMI_703]|nr:hypothetical protein F5884DRAFT_680546 [Xylogone sp. PMI_703]
MAQGAVATLPTNGASLTADELREILECERIVRFRDAVLSGTHPRIKVPPHLARNVSSSLSPAQRAFAAAASGDSARLAPKLPQLQDSAGFASKPPYSQHTVMDESTYSVPAKPTRSEIDPVLLEKSDDLIKAEIMLQRQKLERALREQIEQQRLAAKALLQTSESLPDFDISDVFAKALTIVQPISSTSDIDTVVGAQASANDSFDENSFYSSQHDTPGPSTSSSEGLKDQNDSFSRGVDSTDQRPVESYSTQNQTVDREIISSGLSLSTENRPTQSLAHSQGSRSQRPTIAADHVEQNQTVGVARSIAAGVPIRDDSRISNENRSKTIQDKSIVQDESHTLESEDPSPLIRAHNLSPVAPRPARVSPLATARNPPILQQSISIDEAPPAQVVALRSEPAGVSSSTDSSPRDAKSAGKRKERKKKRRRAASKDNAEQPDSPYIKPEPRSPSPFGVVPLPRPQKRLRQGGQYAAELNYDEPRYDQHVEELDRQPVQQFREPLRRPAYERYDDRYAEDLRPMPPRPSYHTVDRYDTAPSIHVVDRVGDDYVRTSDGHYSRRPRSPTVYAVPYQPTEGRIVRAASRALVDRHLHDEPRYYRESQIPARASVRPDAERSRSPVIRDRRSPIPMGPPRQPVRVVVDEYGREYIDPSPIPIMRQSVAPSIRPREPEFYYERAPVRAVAGRAPVEYEDDGVIYRRTSPNMPPPRRVITQPEYIAQPEYRPYRQREYSVRPVAPPSEEYIQIRGPDTRETSHFEGPPREYIPRAATSFRPIPQYVPRLQSVRPEPPSREYATSIHPEARREMATQPQREYSVRPIEPIPRREHLLPVPAGERYYEDSRPRPNEVAYMERPPMESADVIYMDDSRRDFYQ